MKINKIIENKKIPIAFKAREYAVIKTTLQNCSQTLNAYKLEYSDRNFLDVMSAGIKLKKLTEGQNYPDRMLRSWKKIINNAVLMAGFDEPQNSFLLVKDKTPCAIISYKNMPDCYLDNIASWPVSQNNYVKLAGTSLFKLLFYNCEKNNTRKIGLDVLKNSRIDLKKYYSGLGFVDNSNTEQFITDMYISRAKMLETARNMDSFIKIQEVQNPLRVNLSKILNIKFVARETPKK